MRIALIKVMEPERNEEQERRDAAPIEEIPDPDTSDYNLPFTD